MEKLHVETEQDERSLEKFKEQKMEQTLDYNVRLSDLQQNYSRLAAKTLERSTYLRNIQEKSTEKRLVCVCMVLPGCFALLTLERGTEILI